MPRKPKPEESPKALVPDDPEQFQRFVEMARELGIEEVGEAYERALDVILRPREPGQPAKRPARAPKATRTYRKKKSPL